MLRNDAQASLNELRAALLAAAHHYRAAAHQLPAHGADLGTRARQRERWGEALAGPIHELGDMPDATDPEREMASDLALRMRAVLIGDQAALAALAREDAHLLALARRARQQPLPETALAVLRELEEVLA